MKGARSGEMMARARSLFPGGVNSPVRAFRSVGGEPFVASHGEGPYLFDLDGNRYIDFVLSWGALPLGHAAPAVVTEVGTALAKGTSFGVPNSLEVALADEITALCPHIERLRFVSSGTEATMSAVRLARAFSGRDRIVKFDGCYHGHADSFLVRAGSGVATLGLPDSPGVPGAVAGLTHSIPFNDAQAVQRLFAERGGEIAAVIVEPIVGNSGFILPDDGWLKLLRELTEESGALLIFDEVMTGFRIAPGGARELFGISADLTTLGKVIGGGLPVAAYGGRADIMCRIAPEGDVYQAGTLSGNPLSMAAGVATLRQLRVEAEDLTRRTTRFVSQLRDAAQAAGVDITVDSRGSMWGFFFRGGRVRSLDDARQSDLPRFRKFFHAALERGVYLAPSAFEAAFTSTAHDDAVLNDAVDRLADALRVAAA